MQPYKAHFNGVPNAALYPFGHGLTFGKIEYGGLAFSASTRLPVVVGVLIIASGVALGVGGVEVVAEVFDEVLHQVADAPVGVG